MAIGASEKARKKFPGRTNGWPICHLSEEREGKMLPGGSVQVAPFPEHLTDPFPALLA
jgi:hypothetical protein